MDKLVKTKLCWNCEGTVSINAENCPYCGVSVVPASLDGIPASFLPPYRFGASQETGIPKSPYESMRIEEGQKDEKIAIDPINDFKQILFTTLFLLCGSAFFLFGLVLALFSHNGIFTLQWNGSLWFVYSGLSIPLLLLGWRSFTKFE